jgi:phage N-6-adenine-methyltransferase
MAESTHAVLTSSVNPNWRTPSWLYEALAREFRFVLDAAADPESAKCAYWLGPGGLLDNALCGVSWFEVARSVCFGGNELAIFLNPPYSRKLNLPIAPWVEQCALEGEQGTVVAILPFSPQTKWWRKFVVGDMHRATEIRKFPFRLKFEPPPDYVGDATGANVNSVVAIWKPTAEYQNGIWVPHERYWIPENYPGRRELYTAKDDDNGDE